MSRPFDGLFRPFHRRERRFGRGLLPRRLRLRRERRVHCAAARALEEEGAVARDRLGIVRAVAVAGPRRPVEDEDHSLLAHEPCIVRAACDGGVAAVDEAHGSVAMRGMYGGAQRVVRSTLCGVQSTAAPPLCRKDRIPLGVDA